LLAPILQVWCHTSGALCCLITRCLRHTVYIMTRRQIARNAHYGISGWPNWVRLSTDRTNSGLFQGRFQYILAQWDLQKSRVCFIWEPIWPTLGLNLTSLVCILLSTLASLDDIAYHTYYYYRYSSVDTSYNFTHRITILNLKYYKKAKTKTWYFK